MDASSEILHSIQSIGGNCVLIMRNGNPAQAMIFDTASNKLQKKIIWALSSRKDPDLGSATSIQLLDEPGAAEDAQR